MPKTNRNHVFISYARGDGRHFAQLLYENLNNSKFEVWLDTKNIEAGAVFYDEIREALQNAFVIVVVFTPGAVASGQVTAEWNYALSRFVPPIIPLMVSDCEIPYVLEIFNYIDCRGSKREAGIAALRSRLATLRNDHLAYLENKLAEYRHAETVSTGNGGFRHKIELLEAAIGTWRSMFQTAEERASEKKKLIENEVRQEQERLAEESRQRLQASGRKVVGTHILDVSTYFRDRVEERKALGELLSDPNTRIISIIGRGGIGKTGLVSKVLLDLESNEWTHTSERIPVDGIIYLSTRTHGISLERIFLDCAEMLGGEIEKNLISTWTDPHLDTGSKVDRLLTELRHGLYIILFDNMEDLLDDNRQIGDDDLQVFFDIGLRKPHNARWLVTTRVPINFPREVMKFDNKILLQDGLPTEHAVQMLRDLDPSGEFGLSDADADQLTTIAELVRGVPRALEVVASILANDPFASLEELIEQEELFKRDEFVEVLVETNYNRLDSDSRRVMEALAVFRRPVPMVAIDYLLEPFVEGLNTRAVLTRLIQTHAVTVDRRTKTVSLHPIDRDYIYSQIPE